MVGHHPSYLIWLHFIRTECTVWRPSSRCLVWLVAATAKWVASRGTQFRWNEVRYDEMRWVIWTTLKKPAIVLSLAFIAIHVTRHIHFLVKLLRNTFSRRHLWSNDQHCHEHDNNNIAWLCVCHLQEICTYTVHSSELVWRYGSENITRSRTIRYLR